MNQNQFITFVSILLSLLVITTGFVQFIGNEIENEPGDWGAKVTGKMQFHDALYFAIVTFGLVGYGDIAPAKLVGRMCMTFLIMVAFSTIPMQVLCSNPHKGSHTHTRARTPCQPASQPASDSRNVVHLPR